MEDNTVPQPVESTPHPVVESRAFRSFAGKLLGLTLGTCVLVGGMAFLCRPGAGGLLAGGNQTASAAPGVPEKIGGMHVDPMVGRQLYVRSCATCHGENGGGMPEQGVALRGSAFILRNSDAALLSFVKLGRPAQDPHSITGRAMPPLGGNFSLSQQDLADIVAYLRSMQLTSVSDARG